MANSTSLGNLGSWPPKHKTCPKLLVMHLWHHCLSAQFRKLHSEHFQMSRFVMFPALPKRNRSHKVVRAGQLHLLESFCSPCVPAVSLAIVVGCRTSTRYVDGRCWSRYRICGGCGSCCCSVLFGPRCLERSQRFVLLRCNTYLLVCGRRSRWRECCGWSDNFAVRLSSAAICSSSMYSS